MAVELAMVAVEPNVPPVDVSLAWSPEPSGSDVSEVPRTGSHVWVRG